MAISPPSDIVLDVARAVEPAAVEAARDRLSARAAGSSAGVSGAFSLAEASAAAPTPAGTARAEKPFQKFEAMVLQTFLENMLPKDTESVYGKGMAGDMWKSLMAGELADVMAARGGIGIADRLLGDHYIDGKKTVAVGAVSGGPEQAESDRQALLSTALVQEMQRKLAKTIAEDQAGIAAQTKI